MTAAQAGHALARTSTRFPNWALALAFGSVSAGTYWYVVSKVGGNDLNSALEAEAARQEAAETRPAAATARK
jgi:hypothetical protein